MSKIGIQQSKLCYYVNHYKLTNIKLYLPLVGGHVLGTSVGQTGHLLTGGLTGAGDTGEALSLVSPPSAPRRSKSGTEIKIL